MTFVDRTVRVQRTILSVTLAVTALAFWRESFDVFNTLKATLIVLGAIAILAVGAVRVARTREVLVPVTRIWWAVGAFVAGLGVATLAAANPLRGVVGEPGRHTGLAMYLVYVVLFAVAVRLHRDRLPTTLAKGLVVAGVPVVAYGLSQAAGVQVFEWVTFEGGPQVVSTFGNANFLAAWLGIVVPLFAWLALSALRDVGWRVVAGVLAVTGVAVAAATGSLQGLAGAIPGLAVVLAVWLWTTAPPGVARLRVPVASAFAAAVASGIVLTIAGLGPFGAVRDGAVASYESRIGKWATAWRIFTDDPVTGIGFGGDFGDWFFTYRSASLAAESGLRRSVDDPHNVFVAMFANGGLLLGLGYVAFVALVGWALVRGLRRLDGQERLALAGVGGAWLAYQMQSLVSIDVPPLAVLHWTLAGIVVALGTSPTFRGFALPGAAASSRGRSGRRLRPLTPLPVAAIAVVAAALVWMALVPLRADMAVANARSLATEGRFEAALAAYDRAADIAEWEGMYPALHAAHLTRLDRLEAARERHLEAFAREPHDLVHAINVARTSTALEDVETAGRWYDRVLQIDPKTPETLVEIAEFELEHGDPQRAVTLLERATERRTEPRWDELLAEARQVTAER